MVLNEAVVPLMVLEPSVLLPSLNVTVPDGVDPPDIVAVNVTFLPKLAVESELETLMLGDAFETLMTNVWFGAFPTDVAKVLLPE